jgi:hypothetical protein
VSLVSSRRRKRANAVVLLPLGVLIILAVGVLMGDLTLKEWIVVIAAVAIAAVVVAAWS